GPVILKARRINPDARICAYGLYAPLNREWLQSLGVDEVLGGEFEAELAAIARGLATPGGRSGSRDRDRTSDLDTRAVNRRPVPKLHFIQPDRSGLLSLGRYATVHLGDGRRRVAG